MRTMAMWACGLSMAISFSSSFSSIGFAQGKQADPSGTWRWNLDMNGESIKNILRLETDKAGKLSGTLEARDMKLKVEEGKVDGEVVSFMVKVQLEQTVTVNFTGKLNSDVLEGKITAKTSEGEREFPWEAKRTVEAADVVGAWDLRMDTPDGQTLKPVLTLTNNSGKLAGSYAAGDGKTIEVQDVALKDNKLVFSIDTEYQSNKLHVDFRGRPYGSKLKGTLEYSVGPDSGEIDFSGTRKAE